MKIKIFTLFILPLVSSLSYLQPLHAQGGTDESDSETGEFTQPLELDVRPTPLPTLAVKSKPVVKDESPKPQLGTLSATGDLGFKSRSVGAGAGAADAEASPISGSVSRGKGKDWAMRVFNNSLVAYSVSVRVVQHSKSGGSVKSDSFSFTLKPGESAERSLVGSASSVEASLDLVSFRKVGK